MGTEKKKKPWFVKLIIGLVSFVFVIALLLFGVVVFAKVKYDVDLIGTISKVKDLTQEPSEEDLDYKFTTDDMERARTEVNASITDLITYSEEDGYSVNEVVSQLMTTNISLDGKETAAILNNLLDSADGKVDFMGQSVSFELVQIKYVNITETSCDFDIMVKIDISSVKDQMNFFPANLVAKYIPNNLYIDSNVTVTKTANPFEYSVSSNYLKMNTLDGDGTEELLTTLNKFIEVGNVEDYNLQIGKAFVDGIIGNAEQKGFIYSLKDAGATDFKFSSETNSIVIVK
ncbi:MAG: hypothetical protein ACI311_02960 [Bacilli bacterium]